MTDYANAVQEVAEKRQTFARKEDRVRLTPTALEAMRNLAEIWGLTGEQAANLLGMSATTWDRRKATPKLQLSQDGLTRISALVGIYKGLHLLFADQLADDWPRLRKSGPLFDNRSPIEVMERGGIPAMLEVRQYVDALRGGL